MVIAQHSGFKGACPNFTFVTRLYLLFMRQSLYIKGSQAEPGNQVGNPEPKLKVFINNTKV